MKSVSELSEVKRYQKGEDIPAAPFLTAANSAGYAAPVGLSADPVILAPDQGKLKVLLVKREQAPFEGRWALPGGFVAESEDPRDCANRKLGEKTGLSATWLEQLGTYASSGRDPRGWIPSIGYLALVAMPQLLDGMGKNQVRWCSVDDLPPLAFDHKRIILEGVDRLRGKIWYSNIAVGLLKDAFTLSEARTLYEAITGVAYDPANFARTLKGSGLIAPCQSKRDPHTPGRPPAFYSFCQKSPEWSERRSRLPAAASGQSL